MPVQAMSAIGTKRTSFPTVSMSALEGKADTPTDEPLEADVALQRRFIAPLKCPKVVVASRRSLLSRACLNHLDIEYRISAIPRHEGYGYRQQHQGNEDLSDHLGNFPQIFRFLDQS